MQALLALGRLTAIGGLVCLFIGQGIDIIVCLSGPQHEEHILRQCFPQNGMQFIRIVVGRAHEHSGDLIGNQAQQHSVSVAVLAGIHHHAACRHATVRIRRGSIHQDITGLQIACLELINRQVSVLTVELPATVIALHQHICQGLPLTLHFFV